MDDNNRVLQGDYIGVKAEGPVTIFGLTRGKETRLNHTEKLDQGEVMLLQFTDHVAAVKIRGKAKIYTCFGIIACGDVDVEEDPE